MKNYLIVFAKEPQDGNVKTRLSARLNRLERIDLYKAFLKDTLATARQVRGARKILAYEAVNRPKFLKAQGKDFIFYKQQGKDLGEKMHKAFLFADQNLAEKTLIIGSDSPDLPAAIIKKAFLELEKKDLVIGPCYDGGYYLLGLKRPSREIFTGIKWSTDKVFAQTMQNARRLKKKVGVLSKRYDVDGPREFNLLKRDLGKGSRGSARWTRKYLLDK